MNAPAASARNGPLTAHTGRRSYQPPISLLLRLCIAAFSFHGLWLLRASSAWFQTISIIEEYSTLPSPSLSLSTSGTASIGESSLDGQYDALWTESPEERTNHRMNRIPPSASSSSSSSPSPTNREEYYGKNGTTTTTTSSSAVMAVSPFKPYVRSPTIYGHIHYAKTAGTEINGVLASKYDHVCGHKGYSHDFYQFNERVKNSTIKLAHSINGSDIVSRESPRHNRGRVPPQIMQERGYEDCDYISLESPWWAWKQFNDWQMELHVPCRYPVQHFLSTCRFINHDFDCNAKDIWKEMKKCLAFQERFSPKLLKLPKTSVKCFRPTPVDRYIDYMGERLEHRRFPAKHEHRYTDGTAGGRNETQEQCITNNTTLLSRVRYLLYKNDPYYKFCKECLGSENDILADYDWKSPKAQWQINHKQQAKIVEKKDKRMRHLRKVFPGPARFGKYRKDDDGLVERLYPSPATTVTTDDDVTNVVAGCGNSTRSVDEIQVHLIGWRRSEGIQSLLNSLRDANYTGWNQEIPLYIHTDGESAADVDTIVEQFLWPHGPKILDQRSQNIGLRQMWLTSIGKAAKETGDNTLMLIFEDDIRISSLYFQYLLTVLDRYARNADCRDTDLVGFSLSPIVVQELYKPFYSFDADKEVQDRYMPHGTRHSAYLSSVASSWGAAYWSSHWKQFDSFVSKRMQPRFFNLSSDASPEYLRIPGVHSNSWTKSWKRFMIDFMYAQGKVMLYPNLSGRRGFANALQDDGEHGRKSSGGTNLYAADLVASGEWGDLNLEDLLPPYPDLMVFGLDHKPSTKELLVASGMDFLNQVSRNCTAGGEGCSELLQLWTRMGATVPSIDRHDDYPLICAIDAYTSTAGMRGRTKSIDGSISSKRYLVFDLPPAIIDPDLRRAVILEAHSWAKVLGRTLVLPPVLDKDSAMHDDDQARLLADIQNDSSKRRKSSFDMDEIIHFEEFSRLEDFKAWRIIRATTSPWSKSAPIDTGRKDKEDLLETVDLRHLFDQPLELETSIYHLLGGCEDHVLAFEGALTSRIYGSKQR